uniref:Anaphase-promoting complex subunit 4-like WD40 domain-containing protein n=1 Tax=Palpitomonas bilix TaxID=652834 RepID=A0A7S3D420_9EUKA|mmetsp:Transcript_1904/g.4014  ORF Transcript_1904/g.4014 Transcript_1904/m.4014 type:complete len:304 (+) Transcript_1904:157-1068(+)
MDNTLLSFDTEHQDMIHDAQFDYYGKRLATCSSDKKICIFDVSGENHTKVAELLGHEGPVWQLSWAHPKFGSMIVSCGYDRKVIVWKEEAENQWSIVYQFTEHKGSVNTVAFGPVELGLVFASGGADGHIYVVENHDGNWSSELVNASAGSGAGSNAAGVNALCWAPVSSSEQNALEKRLLVGGCACNVSVLKRGERGWGEERIVCSHEDWVRGVAWAPALALPTDTVASCSQDGEVKISRRKMQEGREEWDTTSLKKFEGPVWSVSWSTTGNVLAVAVAHASVKLYKESVNGQWEEIASNEM